MELITKIMARRFRTDAGRAKLFKQINALMKNDWQVLDIFEYLIKKIDEKGDMFRYISPKYHFLKNARDVLKSSGTLSDCFENWVTPTEFVIIKTGEKTGEYEDAFKKCIELNKDVTMIVKTIKGSLFTPVFAILILIGILIGARLKMMPMLTDLVPLEKWPDLSRNFYDITEAVGGNPSQTLAILVGTFIFFIWATPNLHISAIPQIRHYLDKVIPFNIYKKMQISIFLKSLATLLEAGVRFKESLHLIRDNSNKYMKGKLDVFIHKVTSAQDDSSIFEGDFLGNYGDDLSAMAKGDNLEGAMKDVAEECMEDVTESLPVKMKLIGTLIMLSVVGTVIFLLLAFYGVIGILQSGEI